MRADVNVSICAPDSTRNTRPREISPIPAPAAIKNMNSMRFMQAIEVEAKRQIAIIVEGGGEVTQETRSFDPAGNSPMRSRGA
jgi:aspartyl-tRNA(Asn)/glutamyl-tRNA(Gln) amidotransferase subunit B